MNRNFLLKNINLISLVLYLLSIFAESLGVVGLILSLLLHLLLFPIIICIAIFDIIKNPNSNSFNLMCLLLVAYLVELSYNSPIIISPFYINADILLYFAWLAFFLIILTLFNNFKGNQLFKYSTLLILSFTFIFHNIIRPYWVSTFKMTKNIITKKVGARNKYCNIRTKECVETKIPRIYDNLEVVSPNLPEPVFFASKKGENIIINRLNKSIVSDFDNIEYVGGTLWYNREDYTLFKVQKNKKYGIYGFKESEKKGRIFVPILYDKIEIIKNTEELDIYGASEKHISALGIIAKKSNLYDLYINQDFNFKHPYKDKKDIQYLGKIKDRQGKQYEKYKIDNKYFVYSKYRDYSYEE